MKSKMTDDESNFWNVDLEVSLFHAMRSHKPVGVNRHFQMICIHDKLNGAVSRKVSAEQIWSHLSKMYDLHALHESEILPFPNKPIEFALPQHDFLRTSSASAVKSLPPGGRGTPTHKSSVSSSRTAGTPASKGNAAADGKDLASTPKESGSGKSKPSAVEKVADRLTDVVRSSDDGPKRESRKRTRQTTGSPAVAGSEGATVAKRSRRT